MGEIHLSDAEWEIMNCLWNKPNQKISEIVIALSEKKAWDKHTVITLLNRMEKREQCHLREMDVPKSIIR